MLFDEDYQVLKEAGLEYVEDAASRFLIIKNYPLEEGMYLFDGSPVATVEVLLIIPSNYNASGGDMFWTNLPLELKTGDQIPAMMQFGGGDSRTYNQKEYCRWSRHWPAESWKAKVDNINKILDRVNWALKNPMCINLYG